MFDARLMQKLKTRVDRVTTAPSAPYTSPIVIDYRITEQLKDGPEQQRVVGPLVQRLLDRGWDIGQMMFGKKEYGVPKTPSASNRREKGHKYESFPVDIALFESPALRGDYRALVFIVECKQPNETAGLEQLDILLGCEPHLRLGVWANSAEAATPAVFLFRDELGKTHPQKRPVGAIPGPDTKIDKDYRALTGNDLIVPSTDSLTKVMSDLLDRIVIRDSRVTRRENQLDQLCNVILLKLESDKQARLKPASEVIFKTAATNHQAAEVLRTNFGRLIDTYPDSFSTTHREELEFSDDTLAECIEELAPLNLLGVGAEVVSVAFQVLRSAALKQKEGQYFTPQPVIRPAILAARLDSTDLVLDPACGTGGFLVEAMASMREDVIAQGGDPAEVPRWAQKALHGIDKDSIAIKLTRAVMQIMGDGSANCAKGDSIATHRWVTEYPHLPVLFKNNRFSVIFTNPPFGKNLTITQSEAKKAGLTIADAAGRGEIEIGLAMLDRCHQLLRDDGRLCIVLPETYFFSATYRFVRDWCRPRFVPEVVINVPMEAFQGFCRAKTNVYVFRKLPTLSSIKNEQKRKTAITRVVQDAENGKVTMLNPRTCGIYKSGAPRYKIAAGGRRTGEIDNEMLKHVEMWRSGKLPSGGRSVAVSDTVKKDVVVPTYYDPRYDAAFDGLKTQLGCDETTLGQLIADGLVQTRGGHGSPGNDVRTGTVPYIKVSDIRALRVNINPTNLIPRELARQFWGGHHSGLEPWDLITPNRASANIGEFAVLLPGEHEIVLTKEMLILRVAADATDRLDAFYLLWALCLRAVRDQWRRIALMQTNREDLGARYREIRLPWPPKKADAISWMREKSKDFRSYFKGIASAKEDFIESLQAAGEEYIASVFANGAESVPLEDSDEDPFT